MRENGRVGTVIRYKSEKDYTLVEVRKELLIVKLRAGE
jgi:hypothetical protein